MLQQESHIVQENWVAPCAAMPSAGDPVECSSTRVLLAAVSGLRRVPYGVFPGAVAVADAGQDDHDGSLGGFATGAAELHHGRLGPVRRAAAAICAGAAVARLEGLDAGAVLVGEVDGCLTAHHPLAPAVSLQGAEDTSESCHS